MRIGGLYSSGLRSCSPSDLLPDAAQQMAFVEVGALAVIDDTGALVGIISERDLVSALANEDEPRKVKVSGYASSAVQTAETREHSSVVARRMLDAGIRHLPVVERSQLMGMVSMRDLLAVDGWL